MGYNLIPDNVGGSVGHTINACTNVYGRNTPQQAEYGLFNGINGAYNDEEIWYFYDPQYYLDITIDADCNLWAIGSTSHPTSYHAMVIQKWNGSSWVAFDETPDGLSGSVWNKIYSNLPAGRYKFYQKVAGAGGYTAFGEWYLESVDATQYNALAVGDKVPCRYRSDTIDVPGKYNSLGGNTAVNVCNQSYIITSAVYSGRDKAFDVNLYHTTGSLGDFWHGVGNVCWLGQDFGANNKKVIKAYQVACEWAYLNRAPKIWTFEGSNDNVNWDVLDTQNISSWSVLEFKTFLIPSNTTAYRYYRLNITDNMTSTTYTHIEVVAMYESTVGLHYYSYLNFEIPPSGDSTPAGYFNLVCVDEDYLGRKILIADRVIQTDITMERYGETGFTHWGYYGAKLANRYPNITSTSYAIGSSGTPSNAFDRTLTLSSYWAGATVSWLGQDFGVGNEKVVRAYQVHPYSPRTRGNPQDWTFEGSNDNVNWDILDTKSNQEFSGDYVANTYTFDNTTAYRYYRINITAVNEAEYSGALICELAMYEGKTNLYYTTTVAETLFPIDFKGHAIVKAISGGIDNTDTDNEWDKYIVNSTLNGTITAGDNSTWHWSGVYSFTRTNYYTGHSNKTIRGNSAVGTHTSFAYNARNTTTGYRPVFLLDLGSEEFRKYLLQDDSNVYNIVSDALNIIGTPPVTQAMFDDYGMVTLVSITNTLIQNLGTNPTLLINYLEQVPSLRYNKTGGQIRYLASFDSGTTYKAYTGGTWNTVDSANIGTQGMTTAEINAITQLQWDEIYVDGNIKFLIELQSFDTSITPTVDNIAVTLPVAEGRTDIRYAFSNNGRASWKYHNGSAWVLLGALSNLVTTGMTKTEVEAITQAQWRELIWDSNGEDTLDIAIELITNDDTVSPTVDLVDITYTTIPVDRIGDDISIPTPADNLTRFVWNELTQSYDLKSVEGLLFHDDIPEYYSTQKGIILKYLEMPLMYAGTESLPTPIVLENTFDIDATNIQLTADVSNMPLNSAIKFSLVETPFADADFLDIATLTAGSEQTFYIKLVAPIGSHGEGTFDIRVKGSVPFIP